MIHRLCCLFALVMLAAACETAVEPFEASDRYFSVWGYLDAEADTQFVRVVPLRRTALAPAGPIDAAVTLTDVETGGTAAWRDSVFRFLAYRPDEGHVFWSTARPEVGRRYRLVVRRSDGAETEAEIRMPTPPAQPEIDVPDAPGPSIRRRFRWPAASNVARIQMVYVVSDAAAARPAEREVVVDYTEEVARSGDRVEVVVDVTDDYAVVFNSFGFERGTPPSRIALHGLALRITVASEAWTFVASDVDPELLSFPGNFSNVRNGFGFVGGVARTEVPWTLPASDVAVLGYTDRQEEPPARSRTAGTKEAVGHTP